MGNKTKNVGGGGSTPVAADWAAMLGQGLNSGVYGMPPQQQSNTQIPQNLQNFWNSFTNPQGRQSQQTQSMGQPQIGPGMMPEGASPNMEFMPAQTGGLGIGQPGQNPAMQTAGAMGTNGQQMPQQGGFTGYINNQLAQNPNNAQYFNPNNLRPQDYVAPGAMTFDAAQYQNPNQTMQFGFNPQVGQGPSSLYDQANAGMMGLSNLYQQVGQQNPYLDVGSPGFGQAGSFGSQGLLGDRSGVTSAITNAAQSANRDAVAAARARFTANGGLSFGTPAAYAEALITARGQEALANSLAQADLGYRNHDLGAYTAEQSAQIGNRGINANIYGSQLDAANRGQQNMLSALTGMGQNFQNVAGNEFGQQQLGFNYGQLAQNGQLATNQMNLDSGLGFGQLGLGYDQLNNQAYNQNNQLNLDSGLGFGGLAQQAFNANSNNWANQGGMDLQQRGMMSAQQQNLINQLFAAYGQQAGLGTPQAQMIQTPSFMGNVVNAATGLLPGVAQVKKAFG